MRFSPKIWTIIRLAYDTMYMGLWAILAADSGCKLS